MSWWVTHGCTHVSSAVMQLLADGNKRLSLAVLPNHSDNKSNPPIPVNSSSISWGGRRVDSAKTCICLCITPLFIPSATRSACKASNTMNIRKRVIDLRYLLPSSTKDFFSSRELSDKRRLVEIELVVIPNRFKYKWWPFPWFTGSGIRY